MAVTTVLQADLLTKQFEDTISANAAVVVAAEAITIYAIDITNAQAAINFVKLYNTAGTVTVGTTVPDIVLQIVASDQRSIAIPSGLAFDAGLQIATVTAGGTGGTTSPSSNVGVRVSYR